MKGMMRVKLRKKLWEKQRRTCCWCKREIPFSFATLEHLLPKGLGGKETKQNFKVACASCNRERGCTEGRPEENIATNW